MRSFEKFVFCDAAYFCGKGEGVAFRIFLSICHHASVSVSAFLATAMPPRVATDKNIESTNANTAASAATVDFDDKSDSKKFLGFRKI